MAEPSSHILELAKRGAVLRFRELAHELDLLLKLFPDLRDSFDPDELPVSFIVKRDGGLAESEAAAVKEPVSAAARKAVNQRMKRAWTARRAGSKS
jgi:hypothetical protein